MRRVERWIPVNRVANLNKKMKRVAKIANSRNVPFNFQLSEPNAETISDEEYQQMRGEAKNELLFQFGVPSMDSLDRENPQVVQGLQNYYNKLYGWKRVWIPSDNEKGWEEVWRRVGSNMVMYYGDLADSEWEVIGVLNPMFESAFTSEIISTFTLNLMPGLEGQDDISETVAGEIPTEINSLCEHCDTVRKRNELILVRHKETDEIRRVGSTCLMGYTSIDPKMVVAIYESIDATNPYENSGGMRITSQSVRDLHDFMTLATQYFDSVGSYVRGQGRMLFGSISLMSDEGDYYLVNANYPSTDEALFIKERFSTFLRDGRLTYTSNDVLDYVGKRRISPPTEDVENRVVEMISYILNMDGRSSFDRNLKAIAESGFVSQKTSGYASSIYTVYLRAIESGKFQSMFYPPLPTEEEEVNRGEHLGEIGERITFDAQLIRKQEREGYYGITTMLVFQTIEGSEVIWWSSSSKRMPRVGEIGTVVGTVKKHGEFKGKNTTTITRAKLVDWD